LIPLDFIDLGKDPPREVNVVVEIPKGSNIKYEIDAESVAVRVDRILPVAMAYPGNYGFIPHTMTEDGDAVDVLVLGSESFVVGCVVAVNPIGVLLTEDQDGRDDKIIAKVASKVDPSSASTNDIDDVSESVRNMIEHFFEHHKDLEAGKYIKIAGWDNKDAARKIIRDAMERHIHGGKLASQSLL
jgi:inorganic pyrophosphatase